MKVVNGLSESYAGSSRSLYGEQQGLILCLVTELCEDREQGARVSPKT